MRALMLERWLLYVLRAEPNPLSKRRRFIRLRFDCQLRFAAARIRSVLELGKAKRPSFYRARFVQRGRLRRL